MFFRDHRGDLHATQAVRKISWLAEEERDHPTIMYRIGLEDGSECQATELGYDSILRASWKISPAAPGIYILDREEENSTNDPFNRFPVYAWGLDYEGGLHPIFSNGEWTNDTWAVLNTDGSVSDCFGGIWPSEEKYLDYLSDA